MHNDGRSLTELLAQLQHLDVRLWLDDGTLRYSAPSQALTPALRQELAARKPELLELLRGLQRGGDSLQAGPAPRPATGRDEPQPLSFAQERLWSLDQLEPGNTAYSMHATVRLRGALDPAVLEHCVNEIVARHEPLRTSFAVADGRPVQRVASSCRIPLRLHDLRELSPAERDASARQLGAEQAARPFDLARDPLLRTTLLRLADTEYRFLVTMHHIVADGWSVTILAEELTALYAAFSRGEPSPLKELPLRYTDFAVWQRGLLQGETLERELAYWRRQLGGQLPDLELPLDRPRPRSSCCCSGRAARTTSWSGSPTRAATGRRSSG